MMSRTPKHETTLSRRQWIAGAATVGASLAAPMTSGIAQESAVRATEPPVIDDFALETTLASALGRIDAAGGCVPFQTLLEQSERRRCQLTLPKSGDKALAAADIHRRALPSTMLLAGVGRTPGQLRRRYRMQVSGTAFVISADGAVATNWHIFEGGDGLAFGMANRRGAIFPVTEILAADPAKDIAIVRIQGQKFYPLPLSPDEPVGAWLGVLSHPGGRYFTFTQGHVTRYAREQSGEQVEEWLQTDADFGVGSSGGPALNRFGAVVGMATMTQPIAAEGRPRDFPQQMVVRSCIPTKTILGLIERVGE